MKESELIKNIVRNMTVYLVLAIGVLMAVFSTIIIIREKSVFKEMSDEYSQKMSLIKAQEISTKLEENEKLLKLIAKSPSIQTMNKALIEMGMMQFKENSNHLADDYLFIDSLGNYWSLKGLTGNLSDNIIFRDCFLSDRLIAKSSGSAIYENFKGFLVGTPLFDQKGDKTGVIVSVIKSKRLMQDFLNTSIDKSVFFWIMDDNKTIISYPDSSSCGITLEKELSQPLKEKDYFKADVRLPEGTFLSHFQKIQSDYGLYLVLNVPNSGINQPGIRFLNLIVIMSMILIVMVSFVVYILCRYFLKERNN